jgi:hypothetical protein
MVLQCVSVLVRPEMAEPRGPARGRVIQRVPRAFTLGPWERFAGAWALAMVNTAPLRGISEGNSEGITLLSWHNVFDAATALARNNTACMAFHFSKLPCKTAAPSENAAGVVGRFAGAWALAIA